MYEVASDRLHEGTTRGLLELVGLATAGARETFAVANLMQARRRRCRGVSFDAGLLITCDQVVLCDDKVLEKPESEEQVG